MKEEAKIKLVITAISSIPLVLKFTADAMTARKRQKAQRELAKQQEFLGCLEVVDARLTQLVADPNMTEEEFKRVRYEEVQFLAIVDQY